jgi:hypothetical protein
MANTIGDSFNTTAGILKNAQNSALSSMLQQSVTIQSNLQVR